MGTTLRKTKLTVHISHIDFYKLHLNVSHFLKNLVQNDAHAEVNT